MDKLPVALWMVGIFAVCEYEAQKIRDRKEKKESSPADLIILIIGILILWPW